MTVRELHQPGRSRLRGALIHLLFGHRYSHWVMMAPAIVLLLMVLYYPVVDFARISFWAYNPARLEATPWTLANYLKLFADPYYWRIFAYTLKLSLGVTVICLAIGYPTAHILALGPLSPRWRNLALFCLLSPLFVAISVRSYGWILATAPGGLINAVLTNLGLIDRPVKILYTPIAVWLGLIGTRLVFMVLPIYASLLAHDRSLIEAAQVLGAPALTAWRRITLPLIWPGIATGCLLVFARNLMIFVEVRLLGGPRIQVMGTLLYDQMMLYMNWPFGAAIGITLLIVSFFLIWLANASMSQAPGQAGVKE